MCGCKRDRQDAVRCKWDARNFRDLQPIWCNSTRDPERDDCNSQPDHGNPQPFNGHANHRYSSSTFASSSYAPLVLFA